MLLEKIRFTLGFILHGGRIFTSLNRHATITPIYLWILYYLNIQQSGRRSNTGSHYRCNIFKYYTCKIYCEEMGGGRMVRRKGRLIPVTIYLSQELVDALDELVEVDMYPSRSEAIRAAVRDLLDRKFPVARQALQRWFQQWLSEHHL